MLARNLVNCTSSAEVKVIDSETAEIWNVVYLHLPETSIKTSFKYNQHTITQCNN